MGKYTNLDSNIFSVFASNAWEQEDIKTYPANFIAVKPGSEFIRLNIIPSDTSANMKSVAGLLMIDIFAPSGNGPKRTSYIADKLDSYLSGKSLNAGVAGITQFTTSNLRIIGNDKDNPSLFRVTYTIPFNYFEV